MAFRFALVALLRLRSLLEQREESALARTLAAERRQQQRLQVAEEISERHIQDVQRALASELPASELHWSTLQMQLLQRARANAEQVLHELESERAGQTARYLDAHREVATLEHLKNEMLAAYAQQVSRREQNLIDSLHLARMIRERLSTASQEESSSDSH